MNINDSCWTCSLSELRELVNDREAWGAEIHEIVKNQTWLCDLNWTMNFEWMMELLFCPVTLYSPWTHGTPNLRSPPSPVIKLMYTEISDPIQPSILCHLVFSSCPQSWHRGLFKESALLIQEWPKYWSFSSISFLINYSWLIALDWLVWSLETLKCLL